MTTAAQTDFSAVSTAPLQPTFWTTWLPVAFAVILPIWAFIDFDSYRLLLQNEFWGLLELTHALFPLAAAVIVIGILSMPGMRRDPLIVAYLIVMAAGCIYLAGEEISWGQHWFGWATSDNWKAINDQNETNLHNTSTLLNLLPRAILMAGIILGATVLQWVAREHPEWIPARLAILYPPASLLACAVLIVIFEIVIQTANNFDLSAIVKFHDGEVQELFIVWAVLLYAIELAKRTGFIAR